MKSKGIFYMGRDDCGVCIQVDRAIVQHLDPNRYDLEYVDLSENRDRIAEAESAGVKTVPALVLEGQVFHINFGAELSAIA
ncbi:thioredoxin family protein [Candidatus Gracilibacteria bacterium]|nr:thioredoxin family protein [Candidatus Gracilibacteria bacterium]NJM86486.1 thioredoxin family protein [Hydrococcus sp. RU_2_2]NJP17957.1 thioredoxin family protein [Hydrococcus sp. CRU_1_1]NJQ97586.1 thioredoxin family protein [Hydrococcus sp. CSU_1_8]